MFDEGLFSGASIDFLGFRAWIRTTCKTIACSIWILTDIRDMKMGRGSMSRQPSKADFRGFTDFSKTGRDF
ncbi:hypothetical protein AUSSIE_1 [Sinorhizobium phage Aussie]|nr:hypothetical protein AUSSIE_1 [Sinorhizobium phage Aussie]